MYKLLIVEDEYEIRHGIRHYFPWDELGFIVSGEAENGEEALEFLQHHPVDVILSDIKMPLKSGLDLAKELNEKNDKTPIVFLSGHKDFELVKEALVYGAKDYIVKPTKYQELAKVFQKIKDGLDSTNKLNPMDTINCESALLIGQIKDYIKKNFRTVQLSDLARIAHMNPFYLSTYFKNKTGHSFRDYVISIKMEKAMEYLKDSQYKIYEISEMVGYSNPRNFSKAFHAYFGENPQQSRHGK